MSLEIDDTDKQLLGALQQDARLGVEALAAEAGISAASVQRRLKRLRDAKVIQKDVVVLDPQKLDARMTFIVAVELERERLDQLDAFRRKAKAEPQVQQCYYVTGEADFMLVILTRDMADFEALTHRLFFEDQNVRRFRTSVVMDRTKVGLTVPLYESA